MARFGLKDDSDEDEPLLDATKTTPTVFPVEVGKGKGKERALSPPMEEDELVFPQRRRPQRPAPNAFVEDDHGEYRYAHESRSQDSSDSSDEEDIDMHDKESERARNVQQPLPWAAKIGVEPHRVHVMQASLFRVPEEAAAMKAAAARRATAGKSKPQQQAEKLLSASTRLARKHSRGSETGGEAMHLDKAQRTSFEDPLDPIPHRPTRKFTRVQGEKSVSAGQEGSYVDAGLAFGRSFRVSWGPGGQLARIGGTSTSVVHVDTIRIVADVKAAEKDRSILLLTAHIRDCTIALDESSVPFTCPSCSLTFSTFSSLFPPHDKTPEAQVWRLGVVLFDAPENQFPSPAFVPPIMKHRLSAIQRRTALCEWLASTVAPSVTAILRADPSASSARRAFTRLTGYQVEEAVEEAIADGNVRLATLLSQAGGDAEFRADLEDQLAVWRVEGVDQFVDEAYRKCLAVLAGVTDIWKAPKAGGRSEVGDVHVVKGLDWKRSFGLALWYGEGSQGGEGYEHALGLYERTMGQNGAPMPLPWYKEDPSSANNLQWTFSSSSLSSSSTLESSDLRESGSPDETDALFELLRLSIAVTPLERAIYPRAFGPSPLDYRMTWHLYMLLSRAMRLKDFSDRQSTNHDMFDVNGSWAEGHSETADGVTCAYAAQLEALGLVQEAVFVLLHLEWSAGRKKAIKDLLIRQAHMLEDWLVIGLNSLKIPAEWIHEARACLSQYEGKSFDAYEHFLSADEQSLAHDIAVSDLAPDAVIRGDLSLLRTIFKPFDPQAVDQWSFRGKLFVDYADIIERIPTLLAASQEDAVLDATDVTELERLRTLAPQLIRLLPDILRDRSDPRHNTALSEMLSNLLLQFDSVKSKSGPQPQVDSRLVDEATRLRHIHSTAYNRFLRSVPAVA